MNIKVLEDVCRLKQPSVLRMMLDILQKNGYTEFKYNPSYIIAKGEIPVGLVAHADTVFPAPPTHIFYDTKQKVMWSPQGLGADDRAGIFAIVTLIQQGFHPHIIITTDEELGCVGAQKLISKYKKFPWELKFLIQLDRRGKQDSVFYDLDDVLFESFINQFGFVTAQGSYSDISILAPVWNVAAVNLSVGYCAEHTEIEHLFISVLNDTIKKVGKILTYVQEHKEVRRFPYTEKVKYYDWGLDFTSTCDICGKPYSATDLFEIIDYESGDHYDLCNDCFAQACSHIYWCSKCHEGYLMTDEEEKIEQTRHGLIDTKSWVCKHCRTKE